MASEIQEWAKKTIQAQKGGPRSSATPPSDKDKLPDNPDGGEGDEGDEPDYAEEMAGWLDALAEDHPETAEWIRQLGDAIENEDMDALDLLWDNAPTSENPEYPSLDPEERKKASERIRLHMGHADHTREQAIAIGLRESAPEKYKSFEAARK